MSESEAVSDVSVAINSAGTRDTHCTQGDQGLPALPPGPLLRVQSLRGCSVYCKALGMLDSKFIAFYHRSLNVMVRNGYGVNAQGFNGPMAGMDLKFAMFSILWVC